MFQLGCPNTGGTTVFLADNQIDEYLRVAHRHANMLLGSFSSIEHGASEWTGYRYCIGCYVDSRTVKFFHMFNLDESSIGQPIHEHTYTEKTKEEYTRLSQTYETVKNEPKSCNNKPLSQKYKERVRQYQESYNMHKEDRKK